MDTQEVAKTLKLTAQLMELHEENQFKVKSLSNAAFKLSKTRIKLEGLSKEELENIEGVGKGIAAKIYDIQNTGKLNELEDLLQKTPLGVVEMLSIKGIGPKKIGQLWRELHIESPGELLYACHENRLVDLKGFGTKTQEQVKNALEFNIANSGKHHYASVETFALNLVEQIKKELSTELVSLTGDIRRKCEVVESIDILIGQEQAYTANNTLIEKVKINFFNCKPTLFYQQLFETTGTEEHLQQIGYSHGDDKSYNSEEEIYNELNLPYYIPELREGDIDTRKTDAAVLENIIEYKQLKGALHNHSTYSDGVNTLKEMADACKELGYEYFGICDHSQSAFYANGLKPERIIEQHKEIDKLNDELKPFKIFKGIESDILYNGQLDYEPEILKLFDFVVASVHSNLKMDKEKATQRILTAVENPFTTILGHPTGRLLLSREGYPIDHKKIIDACAANNVCIELNAHPYRLDIDWRWIPYCMDKGVNISINPDAHVKDGLKDMYFGTCTARKGGLLKEMCLNALPLKELEQYFTSRKNKISE